MEDATTTGYLSKEVLDAYLAEVTRLREITFHRTGQPRLARAVADLESLAKELGGGGAEAEPAEVRQRRVQRTNELIDVVDTELNELRRGSNLGAYS
jgi:hypothetical protein